MRETDRSEGSGHQGRPGQGTRPGAGEDLGRRTLEGLTVRAGRRSWADTGFVVV